ncbi:MAG TPA: radical SAM protein, partial [Candidatus Omnitrophota bacterium]|nr:radical SAM protein [Candidatus Omnitrophota bacterium]
SGHSTELVMETSVKKAIAEILRADPNVVLFSTLTATGDFEWSLEVAKQLKRNNPSILTIFGNLHPTLFPEETMAHDAVDILCRGEGEFPVLELSDRLRRGKNYSDIAGLWVRSPAGIAKNPSAVFIEDLDVLPFPDRDLYQKYGFFDNSDSIDVIAGRGCPFHCSFCMNSTLQELFRGKGRFVRKVSPLYMIQELEEVKRKFRPKSIKFSDDLFSAHKGWLKEFSQMYKKRIGLPFLCSVTADTVDDETISWLADAGAYMISMGVETGNEGMRYGLLNKKVADAKFEEAARRIHQHGVKVLTTNIIGFPGETLDNAFETISFNQKIKTDVVYFSVFQPYPQLPLTKKMEASGVFGPIPPAEFNTTFWKGSLLKQDNMDRLVNLHKFFFLVFKFPWLKPVVKFLIQLPPNWFFEQIFIFSYGWQALTSLHRHPLQLLAMALGNLKIFFNTKGASR